MCGQLLYILEWNKRLYITEMGKEGNLNDFLLILQMKQGNEKAFDKFVRKYYAGILSYCRYHCMNQAEAEDLTQVYSLRQIYSARVFLIGVADVFMITLFMFVCCVGMRMQFMDILVQFLFPMVVAAGICFAISQ